MLGESAAPCAGRVSCSLGVGVIGYHSKFSNFPCTEGSVDVDYMCDSLQVEQRDVYCLFTTVCCFFTIILQEST